MYISIPQTYRQCSQLRPSKMPRRPRGSSSSATANLQSEKSNDISASAWMTNPLVSTTISCNPSMAPPSGVFVQSFGTTILVRGTMTTRQNGQLSQNSTKNGTTHKSISSRMKGESGRPLLSDSVAIWPNMSPRLQATATSQTNHALL